MLHYCSRKSIGKSNIIFRQTNYGTSSQDNQNVVHMLLKLELLTIQVLEGMTVEGEEKALPKNIRYKNQLDK